MNIHSNVFGTKKYMTREEQAIVYATIAHAGQIRKYTGEPYIYHPIAVANVIRDVPHDEDMIVAAILHDVVEDTDRTFEEIAKIWGGEVCDLVYWLTDISTPKCGNRKERKLLDRNHIKNAPVKAKTIKLADLINNTESITTHDKDFARVYMKEKRLLLDDALKEGCPILWQNADAIVKKYYKHYPEGL